MKLKVFIITTINEISQGLKEAQEEAENTGILINPSGLAVGDKGDKYLRNGGLRFIQELEIKVAISVTEGKGNKAGVGVVAGFFNAGGSTTDEEKNSSVSVIRFSVPLALPAVETPIEYKGAGIPRITVH